MRNDRNILFTERRKNCVIAIVNLGEVSPGEYDEVWAIVRSPKNAPKWMRHVPELSPGWELVGFYQKQRKKLRWTQKVFREEYVPRFLDEMRAPAARNALNELCLRSKRGETIAIGCFCMDFDKCHRSIIASLLDGAGCEVEVKDGQMRDEYYRLYREIERPQVQRK